MQLLLPLAQNCLELLSMMNGAGLPTSLDQFVDGVVTDCIGPHAAIFGVSQIDHHFIGIPSLISTTFTVLLSVTPDSIFIPSSLLTRYKLSAPARFELTDCGGLVDPQRRGEQGGASGARSGGSAWLLPLVDNFGCLLCSLHSEI